MSIEIKSVDDFIKHIDLHRDQVIYRGQSDANWNAVPSIARFDNHNSSFTWEEWTYLEGDIIESFQKSALPYLAYERMPTNHFEWLILAQHHGIPTRLLDWTSNPLKGLFFAVEDSSNSQDGVVWELEYNGWWNTITEIFETFNKANTLAVLFPDHSNKRIVAQEGCFTIFPLPNRMDPFPGFNELGSYKHQFEAIEKYVIPGKSKEVIRAQLGRLGISHHSIYPGLDGLCKEIRRKFEFSW